MATDIERIQAYVAGSDDIELTDHLRVKYNRIKQMCALMLEHLDDTECIAIYCELTGIEQAQAYRDMTDAKKLGGDLMAIDRKFELLRMYNRQKKLIEKCESAQQYTAAVGGHRNAQLYLDKITEGELIDMTKYKPHTVIHVYDPSLVDEHGDLPPPTELKLLVEKLSKPRIDLDVDDYSEYEEIREELRRSNSDTP